MQNKISKLNTFLVAIIVILLITIVFVITKRVNTPVVDNKENQNQAGDAWKTYPLDILPAEIYPTELVLGNKEDLESFSIQPNSKVSGKNIIQGIVKGRYFFEGNILINILDANKNILKNGNAMSKGNWMTSDPVLFEGEIDFGDLPKGSAYIEIHNDNASGLPENDKSILIPVFIL